MDRMGKLAGLAQAKRAEERLVRAANGAWIAEYAGAILHSAYQPVFRLSGGKAHIHAFEALLRPVRGGKPVSTATFLRKLEPQSRRDVEILARLLHIRNASCLPSEKRRLFLNFNPSLHAHGAMIETDLAAISGELRRAELSPRDVVCEITEQAVRSTTGLKDFVYHLRARGYLVAVDDFGAEASDMRRIADVVPDIVKLDGGFANRLMKTRDGFNELTALVGRFSALRIDTVIEGVETLRNLTLAERGGAAFVQGYTLCRPRLAPDSFADFAKPALVRKIIPAAS